MWRLSIPHLGVLFLPTQVIISVSCGGGLADVDVSPLGLGRGDHQLNSRRYFHNATFAPPYTSSCLVKAILQGAVGEHTHTDPYTSTHARYIDGAYITC